MNVLRASMTNPYTMAQNVRVKEATRRVGLHEAKAMIDDLVSRPCYNRLPRMVAIYLTRLKAIFDDLEIEE